jgi:hypothetical protein
MPAGNRGASRFVFHAMTVTIAAQHPGGAIALIIHYARPCKPVLPMGVHYLASAGPYQQQWEHGY